MGEPAVSRPNEVAQRPAIQMPRPVAPAAGPCRGSGGNGPAHRHVRQVHRRQERLAGVRGEPGARADRPVGLRQVDFPAHASTGCTSCPSSGWITGRVLLDGQDIYASRVNAMQLRRRIGMVFQRPTPFPTMSIYDNVAAGLRVQGRRVEGRARRVVERSLRQAALWDEVKDRLRTSAMALSGGQQQRLCIARAIAPSPEVMLLDEPTASLDPQSTQRIEELVFELKQDFTIIIVTHNMQQAARVSDTTTFFYLGGMVESGSDAADLHRAQERADRGLHHREIRMTAMATPRTPSGSLRRPAPRWRRARRRPGPASAAPPPSTSATSASAYGERQVLRESDLRHRAEIGDRDHRPVGLRQVHVPALDQPAERADPRRAPRGRHSGRRQLVFAPGTDLVALRQRVGMVFQRSNPFPKSIFDNVAYGAGAQPAGRARAICPISSSAASGRPALWDEVKDRLDERAPDCRADSSSGSASPARSATSPRCC